MTFQNTAWAIDGALLTSSLARRAEYAAVGGAQGIVNKADLKVTQLGTPGVGILIAPGVGLVNNDYQTTVNETYVVSNPSTHTIPSGSMPSSNPSARSFIVAVVVGDPDFSQTGHPFMQVTDPPAGTEESFNYVRPVLIQVANSSIKTLDVDYPALVLARIDLPANSTTVTNAMITDLRKLARPRQSQEILVSPAGAWDSGSNIARIPSGSSFGNWGSGQYAPSIVIPSWATRAIMVCSVNGVRLSDATVNVSGAIRANLGTAVGPNSSFDLPIDSGAIRLNLQAAGSYDVSALAGTTVTVRVEGYENVPASPADNKRLDLRGGAQQIFDIRFFEE